jgi:hypothetical protein
MVECRFLEIVTAFSRKKLYYQKLKTDMKVKGGVV